MIEQEESNMLFYAAIAIAMVIILLALLIFYGVKGINIAVG